MIYFYYTKNRKKRQRNSSKHSITKTNRQISRGYVDSFSDSISLRAKCEA